MAGRTTLTAILIVQTARQIELNSQKDSVNNQVNISWKDCKEIYKYSLESEMDRPDIQREIKKSRQLADAFGHAIQIIKHTVQTVSHTFCIARPRDQTEKQPDYITGSSVQTARSTDYTAESIVYIARHTVQTDRLTAKTNEDSLECQAYYLHIPKKVKNFRKTVKTSIHIYLYRQF